MSQLELNTTALQELLDEVNNLPDGEGGGGGTVEITLQSKTVTPSASQQEVTADSGYDGLEKVTVEGDANLVAENIKNGVSIFGVTGTHEGGEDLDAVIAEQAELIEELSTALENKAGGGTSGENKLAKLVSGESVALTAEDLGGATKLEDHAFCYRKNLTSITIPNNVESIGIKAFYFCTALTSVTIPSSVTSIGIEAFAYCDALTSVTIPSSITSIGESMFAHCTALTSVTIPSSVTSIGATSFIGCNALKSIAIPSSVTSIGRMAFSNCTIMEVYDFSTHTSVPSIQSYIFSGIPPTCQIKVPAALYDEWISATNWSAYADYIVAV